MYEVLITGNRLDRAYNYLTAGKRESIRENGSTVMRIQVTRLEEEPAP